MSKVPPLKSRIHTLDQLQRETLRLIEGVRKQFHRQAYEGGLSDNEFLEQVVGPLETKIRQDQEMAAMLRFKKSIGD